LHPKVDVHDKSHKFHNLQGGVTTAAVTTGVGTTTAAENPPGLKHIVRIKNQSFVLCLY
jgi:hypothetical protein